MRPESLVVSCEHASNRVPAIYRPLFRGAGAELRGHHGWDIGAAGVAEALATHFRVPLFAGAATRLLIDLNRSLHHPRVFSRWTRGLSAEQRRTIVEAHYAPYRNAVERHVDALLDANRDVVHLSVHSFTPTWQGERRHADLGFLYDPRRRRERQLGAAWKSALATIAPGLRVRRNYPYRGTSDGFSVALRRIFPAARYACIELEINQARLSNPVAMRQLARPLATAIEETLKASPSRRRHRP
jgi:predicted N-formylglutamate amidohydrolase